MSHHLVLAPDLTFSNNKLGSFCCVLNEPLQFNKPYEVGITDFIYNNNISSESSVELEFAAIIDPMLLVNQPSLEYETNHVTAAVANIKKHLKHSRDTVISYINIYQNSSESHHLTQNIADMTNAREEVIAFYKNIVLLVKQYGFYYVPLNKLVDQMIEILATIYLHKKNPKRDKDIVFYNQNFDAISNAKAELTDMKNNTFKKSIVLPISTKKYFFQDNVYYYQDKTLKPYFVVKNLIKNDKIQHISIFTNIINDSVIFNRNEPILKLVKFSKSDEDIVEKNYQRPEYITCNKTYINRIYFEIKDNHNNIVNFDSEPVIIKLHFRPKK
jgi:hypothetical protein